VDLDKESLTIRFTPHAMRILSNNGLSSFDLRPSSHSTASGFYPETGTPQDDTSSPVNRNAALDVLQRALHDIDPTSFLLRTNSVLHPLADTAYADDLFSVSAHREGLQLQAETVSAFTIIFGIIIAIHKLRTFAKCWGVEPSHYSNNDYALITHGPDWSPQNTLVRHVDDEAHFDSVFKYLGVQKDVNNRFRRQHDVTKALIRQTGLAATSRQASAETIYTVMVISPFRVIPGKYCP